MKLFYQSEIHKKKLKKNIAVMAAILGFCGLIWAITMIRIAGN